MPQAENHGPDIKEHVNSLGEKLKTLRVRLRRCVSSRPVLSLAASLFFPTHHLLTRLTAETETQAGRGTLGKALEFHLLLISLCAGGGLVARHLHVKICKQLSCYL